MAEVARGWGTSEGDDPLCDLAGRVVAAVEAPGGASALRNQRSAALTCGGVMIAAGGR